MKSVLLLVVGSVVSAAWQSVNPPPIDQAVLPDSRYTPGAIVETVTPSTLTRTICTPMVRETPAPDDDTVLVLKQKQLSLYGYRDRDPSHYDEVSLIPSVLGGAPTSPADLWPVPRNGFWTAERKQQLDTVLHQLVCRRQISLYTAQAALISNWERAYVRFVVNADGSDNLQHAHGP